MYMYRSFVCGHARASRMYGVFRVSLSCLVFIFCVVASFALSIKPIPTEQTDSIFSFNKLNGFATEFTGKNNVKYVLFCFVLYILRQWTTFFDGQIAGYLLQLFKGNRKILFDIGTRNTYHFHVRFHWDHMLDDTHCFLLFCFFFLNVKRNF